MNGVSAPSTPSIDCLAVLVRTPIIADSKCISKLAPLWPPSSHDHGLQVHISKLAPSRPPSISPNSLDYGHQSSPHHGRQMHPHTRLITAFKCISKLTSSQASFVSLNSPKYGGKVRTITASKCIAKLAQSHLQVLLETRSITASECISAFTRSTISGAPRIAVKHRLQPVQICRV
jgi:hypothetical protein